MSNLGVLGVFRLKFYFFEHTIMIYVQNVCHVLAFSERSEHFLFLQFVGPGQLKMIPPPPPDLDDWVIPEDRHSMQCCVQFLRVWVIPEDRHSMPCCVQFLRVSSSPARPGTESRRSRPPPRTTRRWMVFLLLPAVEIPMNADDCF